MRHYILQLHIVYCIDIHAAGFAYQRARGFILERIRGRFRAYRLYNIISTRPCCILDVYRGPKMNTKANYLLHTQQYNIKYRIAHGDFQFSRMKLTQENAVDHAV